MGHVDHGKTTLLDAIRETRVTEGEAGGITQHIGAYQVEIKHKKITFLDTPGHEAFTMMRARGAKVTDITILVVAADDGVMPQTVEAINHAKAANVPIIVAVNKIDKPDANVDRIKQELSTHGLVCEEWGGDTIFVNVSAKQRTNLDELLEMILLVAEVQELRANPAALARGTVIEAELDKGRGPVARVLVQSGTLKIGDPLVAGNTFGRVRAMVNDKGRRLKEVGPSTPVELTGLNGVPHAGDQFIVFENESKAREIADKRSISFRQENLGKNTKVTLDDLFTHIKDGDIKELNVIIKADVQGSVEALRGSLEKIDIEGVRVRIIHTGAGAITESDIILASASSAIIIGFNVRPEPAAKMTADEENVDIRLHSIIYNVIAEIESAMKGMLDPIYKENIIGQAEVRNIIKISKVGNIAGCMIINGKVTRNAGVRLIRDGVVVFEGKIDALKRFKDDAKEVAQGYECGISLDGYHDIKELDIIEAYLMETVER
jgi:translation initiation factor IF-2